MRKFVKSISNSTNKHSVLQWVILLLSPILSDIVMKDLEIECIQKLNVKPLFYFRYVDDILLCVPSNSIDHTLNTFNTYDKNLQFTVEIAQYKSISFLDVKIIIDQHRHIITNWYRKPTFSGRYLNYNSHHPLSNKIAIIYCLVDRPSIYFIGVSTTIIYYS